MKKPESLSDQELDDKSVKLPVIDFFKINIISFLIPFYICLGLFLVIEYVLLYLFSIPFIVNFLLLPAIFLFLYYVYLIFLIEVVALWVRRWNKKSPPKQGIFRRILDDPKSEEGKLIKYYHKRGFIIKFPVWLTSKSLFPWLINRTLRKIGHNKIKKNTIYCDGFVGLEFTDIGENTFIYPGAALSSHAVNSIFGKLSIIEIQLGKNSTFYSGNIAGPGVITKDNFVIYPNTTLHKNWRGKKENFYYQGNPGRPISREHEEST